jgi:hypothetical protein
MTNPAPVVPSFDQLLARIEPGSGVVARFPGIVAVCATTGPDAAGTLDRFLTICSEVSAAGARAPGRRLARQLGAWLADLDEAPALGTVAPTEGGLAVFLSGPASLRIDGVADGLSGRESAGWLDRIIEWPSGFALSISADSGAVSYAASVFDLRQGVVPAGGVVLTEPGAASQIAAPDAAAARHAAPDDGGEPVTGTAPEPEPAMAAAPDAEPEPDLTSPPAPDAEPAMAIAPEPVVAPEPDAAATPGTEPELMPTMLADAAPASAQVVTPAQIPPAPEPVGDPAAVVGAPIPSQPRPPLVPPIRSARIFGAQQQEPPRPALPVASVAGEPIPMPESDGTPMVQGFMCSRGHLNDPRGLFCGICGIRMAERTGILTIGRRPPLGLLVFDDGVTFTVDADYLLGREPDADARVRQGAMRPLVVIDNRGAVSRRHAEITLDGWVVLLSDAGSANGTFIAPRGQQNWSALVPQRPVALEAGTRVRLGSRMFVFESPHGAP